MTELEKVLSLFAGMNAGDANDATRWIDPKRFVQHDPNVADGVDGWKRFIREAQPGQLQLEVVRAFQDGDFVVTQTKGHRAGQNVFFDVFRFEHGLVVEQWAFSAKEAPPNKSGHTQNDGPTEAKHPEDTEKNKALLRSYYENFHIRGHHSELDKYFKGDLMVRHEPGVRDGIAEFMRDLSVVMQHRTIDEIKLLLGQGDLVFVAARGTHENKPCAYIDLYRMEDGKVVEHWGFPEMLPSEQESKNKNGAL